MTLGELGELLNGLAAVGILVMSWRHARKLEQVHKQTNSLALRNEAIAKELGVREGIEQEQASPRGQGNPEPARDQET